MWPHIVASDERIFLVSDDYEEHVKALLAHRLQPGKGKQYFTEMEVQATTDEFMFHAQVHFATGSPWDAPSRSADKQGHVGGGNSFPRYCFGRTNNPPHYVAVVGGIHDRVDGAVVVLPEGSKRRKISKDN